MIVYLFNPAHNGDVLHSSEIVKILIACGAKVNIINGSGETPLFLAMKYSSDVSSNVYKDRNIEIMKILLNHDAGY